MGREESAQEERFDFDTAASSYWQRCVIKIATCVGRVMKRQVRPVRVDLRLAVAVLQDLSTLWETRGARDENGLEDRCQR